MEKNQGRLHNGYFSFLFARALRGFVLDPYPEDLVGFVKSVICL